MNEKTRREAKIQALRNLADHAEAHSEGIPWGVAGLRSHADYLEAHPEEPLPPPSVSEVLIRAAEVAEKTVGSFVGSFGSALPGNTGTVFIALKNRPSIRSEIVSAFRFGRDPEFVDVRPLFPELRVRNVLVRVAWWAGHVTSERKDAGDE